MAEQSTPKRDSRTSEEHIICHLCEKKIAVDPALIKKCNIYGSECHDDDSYLSFLRCKNCNKDVGVLLEYSWICINKAAKRAGVVDGIHQVKEHSDRVILYILSQVFYNQYDIEEEFGDSPFKCHSPNELAWLLWMNGEAIGFYTVKNKGDFLYDMPYCRYDMTMLDTIYVRQTMRYRGFGTRLIRHFLQHHCGQNVGFSSPLSYKLLSVIYKILLTDVTLRDHVWECSHDGSEGYRRNIWLQYRSVFS